MANTLKFGAGQWATKEGSTLAYNDENDNYKPLPFDFTRASSATVVNKAGLIETVGNAIPRIDFLGNTQGALKLETQRTNVITYSESFPNTYWTKSGASIQGNPSTAGSEEITNGSFDTDSDWTLGTGWTISGGKANSNSTIGFELSQPITYTFGKTYKVTYTISDYVSGSIRVYYGGGSAGLERNANGTYTDYIQPSGSNNFYIRSVTAFTGSIDNVSVKEVQGFTSPDGTNNAYKLVEGASNGQHQIYPTSSSGADAVRTISFFVKMDGVSKIGIRNNDGKYITYDIVNNTTLDKTITNDIVSSDFNNGWKKLSIAWDSTTVITGARIFLLNDAYTSGNPLTYSYTGDGTSGVYIYGAQVEPGSYSTSYISTSGSAVTRLRDECLKDDFSILTVGNSYTLFFDVDLNEKDDNKTFFNIENTSGATSFTVRSVLGGVIRVYNNLDSQYPTNNLASSTNKWVVRIDGTSFKIFGAEGSLSGTLTTARNMGEGIFGRFTQTKINDFKVYNTALSDSECEALTS